MLLENVALHGTSRSPFAFARASIQVSNRPFDSICMPNPPCSQSRPHCSPSSHRTLHQTKGFPARALHLSLPLCLCDERARAGGVHRVDSHIHTLSSFLT